MDIIENISDAIDSIRNDIKLYNGNKKILADKYNVYFDGLKSNSIRLDLLNKILKEQFNIVINADDLLNVLKKISEKDKIEIVKYSNLQKVPRYLYYINI